MPTPSSNARPFADADRRLTAALAALPGDYWDFKDSDVREYTHGIHSYPAVMVCPISRNILRIVRELTEVHTLFDPFSGSGTVLVEGMLAGVERVFGNDINPLALFLSKVKTTPLPPSLLERQAQDLCARVEARRRPLAALIDGADDAMRQTFRLDLTAKDGWGAEAPRYLGEYAEAHALDIPVPAFRNLGYWFKPRVILLLSLLRQEIGAAEDQDVRDFFLAAFSETSRLVSNQRNGEFKMFRMKPEKVERFQPDVIGEFFAVLRRNLEKMAAFTAACAGSPTAVTIYRNNAAQLPDVPDGAADLVITSPPYGDSRTTVAYGEYSRLSLQWLGLSDLSEAEIMGIDRSLMGGSRPPEGFVNTLPSPTLRRSLEAITAADPRRAGDVYSFYADLRDAIAAVARKTRSGGYHFWVVGNRTVKDQVLQTDRIIAELAEEQDLAYVCTIGRNIINKVMPSQNSPSNETGVKSSTMTNEHIVVLRRR